MNITPRKILMVHGDKEGRGKLAIMLARFGHCVSFFDGATKPEISADEYDLIIVDEYLDRGAGFVFLHHLSLQYRAKTIFLSSGGAEERMLCRDSIDIYECLEKPVIPLDLAVVVCDFFISCLPSEERMVSVSL
jgi:DNA-binding response OmpR family regulator